MIKKGAIKVFKKKTPTTSKIQKTDVHEKFGGKVAETLKAPQRHTIPSSMEGREKQTNKKNPTMNDCYKTTHYPHYVSPAVSAAGNRASHSRQTEQLDRQPLASREPPQSSRQINLIWCPGRHGSLGARTRRIAPLLPLPRYHLHFDTCLPDD